MPRRRPQTGRPADGISRRRESDLKATSRPYRRPVSGRLCAAIVDRLTFNGTIIETGADSYRLAHSQKHHQLSD
jgi:ribosomal protein L34E